MAAAVLFASDRTCCVCRVKGKPVQIHHLDEDPSNSTAENTAVLCFDCHRDTQIRGGFDRKLDAAQVVLYRDDWIARVSCRREGVGVPIAILTPAEVLVSQQHATTTPGPPDLALIASLPQRRTAAYHRAQPKWEAGSTYDMMDGSKIVIEELQAILVDLAGSYPPGHFDERRPDDYFSARAVEIGRWHGQCLEPHGAGTGGTIVGPVTGSYVIAALERMVEDLVDGLTSYRDDFNLHAWREAWRAGA